MKVVERLSSDHPLDVPFAQSTKGHAPPRVADLQRVTVQGIGKRVLPILLVVFISTVVIFVGHFFFGGGAVCTPLESVDPQADHGG